MKILFVSDVSIQDVIGGAERVLFEQTTRLAAKGHDVHILTRRLPSHQSDCDVIQNVREWRYSVNQSNAVTFFVSTMRNCKKLFETLAKTNNFDCINFHQPFSAFAVMMSDSCKKNSKVYTCLSFAFEEYASRNAEPHSLIKKIAHSLHIVSRRRIEQKALNQSDRIVALSRFTRDKLLNVYGFPVEDIIIIPGGIDLVRFHPADDKRAVRERLHLPTEKMILLTVRNLVQRMGIENLIIAMREIIRLVPDIYLIIGGTGPLKEDLAMMCRRLNLDRYIHFTGFIPEDALPEYYQAADIFVLPTIELEGFGLVTLEALASGTPVLGTPVGGTLEILSRFDSGLLFADKSHEAISRLVIETCKGYLNQPDKLQLDSERCRRFAEKYYSWDNNITATEALFLESIKY
ncbi:MAG: glycosyltransferase family 1 protein [Desulfobacteraceae bacterium]|nr:MAG: glycosyltransferase family 1 protein [Desulfobacteraceae bacterium]